MKKYIIELPDSVEGLEEDGKLAIDVTIPMTRVSMSAHCEVMPYEEQKTEEHPSKPWRSSAHGEYWCLNNCGSTLRSRECKGLIDDWNYISGNYFKSQKGAEFHRKELLVYNALKAYAEPEDEQVWDGKVIHYFLVYPWDGAGILIDYTNYFNCGCLYFKSKDILEKAIKDIGKDRIMKYYFHIKED